MGATRTTALLLLVLGLLLPRGGEGHSLSRSYSRWDSDGRDVRVTLLVPVLELVRMRADLGGRSAVALAADPGTVAWLGQLAQDGVRLADDDAGCVAVGAVHAAPRVPERIDVRWRLRCLRPPAPGVTSALFFDTAPSHVHHVVFRSGEAGEQTRHEALLTAQRRTVEFVAARGGPSADAAPDVSPGLVGAVILGLEHVASGLDHVAFVVALLLLGGPLLRLLGVSLGFTLGHSVTLALAALGVVGVDAAGVEVLVGLSIAYAALSCFHAWAPPGHRGRIIVLNLGVHAALATLDLTVGGALSWRTALASAVATTCHLALHRGARRSARLRASLAFLFGLVHGFAFAGALGDVVRGADLVSLLLGFNVGVELAQSLVLAGTVAVFALATRLAGATAGERLRAITAAAVLAFGLSLTLTRALGG